MTHKTCPHCFASLDFGENCDCEHGAALKKFIVVYKTRKGVLCSSTVAADNRDAAEREAWRKYRKCIIISVKEQSNANIHKMELV